MGLFDVDIKKKDDHLRIKWQLSKIDIPLDEIKDIIEDEQHEGLERTGFQIGQPFRSTHRVVIHTAAETYVLHTSKAGTKSQILSYMNES
ncbi:hypothetical protein H0266_15365 [Halobacillus locisalis]|uniref:Sublancin immunity protein SunI-like PH domain-containing protein n=1 Tax=Halobacillus locisalis TaxID=220753 RepID=A0A838CXD9_9BACI|nr:hypothetical protein [Halobacillus locisalis]MBA2176276.1 hypothetical protein [Halobacillus locisalis]